MKMRRAIDESGKGIYDLVIIGGGITGASIAYEAALRGLSVSLFEKSDFGGATSAATSKLIHGGLRYLANGEFGIVRESLQERRVLSNIAPNLVYPMPCIIPHYTHYPLYMRKGSLKIGMILYDLLSAGKKSTWDHSKKLPSHVSLGKNEVLEKEPFFPEKGLTGGVLYYDCDSISPERLTLAFIKSAHAFGASVCNYARVDDFIKDDNNRIGGIMVRDIIGGGTHPVRGRCIVNCAGPWADLVLGMATNGSLNRTIRRSEGIHLLTKRLAGDILISFRSARGRNFFIRPWRGHSLIGTTDREYQGDPDSYRVTRESIEDFLLDINSCFEREVIAYCDILACYGGLRPLVETGTEGTYSSSRRYEIYEHDDDGFEGLITVEGGKYTLSRSLAEKVVSRVGKKLGKNLNRARSADVHLNGCSITNMEEFMERGRREYNDFPPETVDQILRHYGSESGEVFKLAKNDSHLAEQVNESGEIMAQVEYAVSNEMAMTLSDILRRRTGIGQLGYPGDEQMLRVAGMAASMLSWNEKKKEREMIAARDLMRVP